MPKKPKRPALPDPWASQTDQPRVAVEGRLAKLAGNGRIVVSGRCTLMFVRRSEGWLVYRLALEEDAANAALLTDEEVRAIADGLGGRT